MRFLYKFSKSLNKIIILIIITMLQMIGKYVHKI